MHFVIFSQIRYVRMILISVSVSVLVDFVFVWGDRVDGWSARYFFAAGYMFVPVYMRVSVYV